MRKYLPRTPLTRLAYCEPRSVDPKTSMGRAASRDGRTEASERLTEGSEHPAGTDRPQTWALSTAEAVGILAELHCGSTGDGRRAMEPN